MRIRWRWWRFSICVGGAGGEIVSAGGAHNMWAEGGGVFAKYALRGVGAVGGGDCGGVSGGFDCVILEEVMPDEWWGRSLEEAFWRFETLEFLAKTVIKARMLCGSAEEVRWLTEGRWGWRERPQGVMEGVFCRGGDDAGEGVAWGGGGVYSAGVSAEAAHVDGWGVFRRGWIGIPF